MLLAEALNRNAREIGDREAFVAPEGWSITYRELDHLSDELAVALAHRGVRAGAMVAIVMPSTIDWIVAYAALTKLGVCTIGLNSLLSPREREAALAAAQPSVVIATSDLTDGLPTDADVIIAGPASAPAEVFAPLRAAHHDEVPPRLPPDPDRGVVVCFTSGSSGTPKGVLFRERQIRAIADLDTGGGGWGTGTHSIAATQFAHVGGSTKMPWILASGGTVHLLHRWRARPVLELTERYRMASVNAGPAQLALMLREPDFDAFDLSSVRALVVGTGPSSPALVIEARERFHAGFSARYSSTESGGVGLATALDAPDEEALYTVGRPRAGVEAKVADDEGRELPVGEVGELWLRSPATMSEYVNDPDATALALVGGWLRTGDLGVKDDAGCYRIAGRMKEMFIRGGYNVYPVEVEHVLASHPKVHDVAIVPRPDPVMGEIGVAIVVPRQADDPPTLDELRTFGEAGLARYKLPERLRVVGELPLNATHKLDRRTLAERERAESESSG